MSCVRATVALYPLSSPNHNYFLLPLPVIIVALYPLSSPNHNLLVLINNLNTVALYPLSSPNHNCFSFIGSVFTLRYILFHHQTTTAQAWRRVPARCVISSFITKPQPPRSGSWWGRVALYPLSSPNHNCAGMVSLCVMLRYILFHHQTTTRSMYKVIRNKLRYILFHHQTTTARYISQLDWLLRYILFHHQTTTRTS